MRQGEQGLSYLAIIFAIAVMEITLTIVAQRWSVVVKRDREADLWFRGSRIKAAIEAYAADYDVHKGTRPNRYPLRMDDLVEGPKRYLQAAYKDPMTGEDFELITVNGEIRGVKSTSQDTPMNKERFKGAATYSHVLFQATPRAAQDQKGPKGPGAVQGAASTGTAINPLNPLSPVIGTPVKEGHASAELPPSPTDPQAGPTDPTAVQAESPR